MTDILMVCEGNVCRSPLAQALLSRALPTVRVSSAGTRALVGQPADRLAIELAQEHGMDLSQHVAKELSGEHLRAADIVLAMTGAQRAWILDRFPFARGKVFRLGEQEQVDIVDPYQRSRLAFEISFAQIRQGVTQWCEDIASLAH
jgi:protein-tyrosine phosphatase